MIRPLRIPHAYVAARRGWRYPLPVAPGVLVAALIPRPDGLAGDVPLVAWIVALALMGLIVSAWRALRWPRSAPLSRGAASP